jgi:hypothetical protein
MASNWQTSRFHQQKATLFSGIDALGNQSTWIKTGFGLLNIRKSNRTCR